MSKSTALTTDQQQLGPGVGASPVPETYSTPEEEYEVLTQGVGLLDRSDVGRLSISGEDGLDLLNRLSTNELMDLQPGEGAPTILTSNKGRIVDLLHVFRHEDHLLVLTSQDACQKVIDWIDFYTIMEDVVVRDLTGETAMLSVVGPNAASLLDRLTGRGISSLERNGFTEADFSGAKAAIYRTDLLRLPSYDIVVDAADVQRVWAQTLNKGQGFGLRPVGSQAWEIVRIERGVPAFGAELAEDYNPLEANLLDLVSFTKGCYVGQEVVARLNTYNKVQKQLVGLRWSLDAELVPDAKLTHEGKVVGVVTSAARQRGLAEGIGLGYVRKTHTAQGTGLVTQVDDTEIPVEVVGLPQ